MAEVKDFDDEKPNKETDKARKEETIEHQLGTIPRQCVEPTE